MFGSTPSVHDQVFQRYISMLKDLIVNRWSAAEYLPVSRWESFRCANIPTAFQVARLNFLEYIDH